MRFADVVKRPPDWSDDYYGRRKKQDRLDQIIDIPYFGDSRDVALIQLADLGSFFLRRYAEIKDGLVPAKYGDEEERVTEWVKELGACAIPRASIYPRTKRGFSTELFYRHAPASIRNL